VISNAYLAWIRMQAGAGPAEDSRSGEWPWTAEGLMRRVTGEEGRGVLMEELLGDEDGPGDEA
jgi:hypothetical protein